MKKGITNNENNTVMGAVTVMFPYLSVQSRYVESSTFVLLGYSFGFSDIYLTVVPD